MRCPLCGHPIVEGQKFCPECAHPLKGITDSTMPIERLPAPDEIPAADAVPSDSFGAVPPPPAGDAGSSSTIEPSIPDRDPDPDPDPDPGLWTTDTEAEAGEAANGTGGATAGATDGVADDSAALLWATDTEPSGDADAAPPSELPALGDLPTREIRIRPEIPDPLWATRTDDVPVTDGPGADVPGTDGLVTDGPGADGPGADGPGAERSGTGDPATTAAPPARPAGPAVAADDGPELFDDLTTSTPADAMAAIEPEPEAFATTPIAVTDTPASRLASGELTGEIAGDTSTAAPAVDATTTMDVQPGRTDEVPLFDGSSDIFDFPPPREPFKLKVVFLLAFFGAIAVLMSAAADVVDIRTSTPVDGIATGVRTLDSLGTNLAIAGFCGASVMALGGLLACFGFRWGAGLAGGAGLALVGWAGLVIGLAELRVASAESITRQTTDIVFTLKVTRDVGFWLVVAVAVIGLLVFLASLRSIATGGQPALNPWIAALGAVAGLVLAAGPLLPEGNATFANNYRSVGLIDIPSLYFGGRLAQLGLVGLTVVFGLLIVRSYGLGLAVGGLSVAVWLWASSLAQVGSFPMGIAAGNFGARNSEPHAVTTVGIVITLAMLLITTVLATISNVRHRPRY